MNPILHLVEAKVSRHMDQIVGCFKPGAKIAVLVRHPGAPDQDFMMTNDDPAELIAMLERRNAESKAATK